MQPQISDLTPAEREITERISGSDHALSARELWGTEAIRRTSASRTGLYGCLAALERSGIIRVTTTDPYRRWAMTGAVTVAEAMS